MMQGKAIYLEAVMKGKDKEIEELKG